MMPKTCITDRATPACARSREIPPSEGSDASSDGSHAVIE